MNLGAPNLAAQQFPELSPRVTRSSIYPRRQSAMTRGRGRGRGRGRAQTQTRAQTLAQQAQARAQAQAQAQTQAQAQGHALTGPSAPPVPPMQPYAGPGFGLATIYVNSGAQSASSAASQPFNGSTSSSAPQVC